MKFPIGRHTGWSLWSVRSVASTGSVFSIASAGSFLCIGCTSSILSIGSVGSVLSIGSTFSLLGFFKLQTPGTLIAQIMKWNRVNTQSEGLNHV
jgi:hypothetical protein